MCREAQVTLIELNRVAEEIRARNKNKAQSSTTNKTQTHKPNKSGSYLVRQVKRGTEFIFLSVLSS